MIRQTALQPAPRSRKRTSTWHSRPLRGPRSVLTLLCTPKVTPVLSLPAIAYLGSFMSAPHMCISRKSLKFARLKIVLYLSFIYLFIFAVPCGMRDLSSLTRDRTHAPAFGAQSLNHWTTVEVLILSLFIFFWLPGSPLLRTGFLQFWRIGATL